MSALRVCVLVSCLAAPRWILGVRLHSASEERPNAEANIWSKDRFSKKNLEQTLVDSLPKWESLQGVKKDLAGKWNVSLEKPTWYYHLHIPKAAGTSVAYELHHVWKLDHVDSVEGCWDRSHAKRPEDPPMRVVTLLRDPVMLIRSLYNHCKTSPELGGTRALNMTKMPENIETWLEYWKDSKLHDKHHQGFNPKKFFCYKPIDFQATRLSCEWVNDCDRDKCNECKRDYATVGAVLMEKITGEKRFSCINKRTHKPYASCKDQKKCESTHRVNGTKAIQNLQNSWFVGVSELYQESMCLLHSKVYGKVPKHCDCTNKEAWDSYNKDREKDGGLSNFRHFNAENKDPITEAQIRLTEEIAGQDYPLYKAAVRMLKEEGKKVEETHGVKVVCEDRLRKFHEAHPRAGEF